VSFKVGIVIALIGVSPLVARAQPAVDAPTPPPASTAKALPESAPIEEVIEASDQGYRFDAYVVRWHGARVLVSDPLGVCHLSVGDSIHFAAGHSDVGERHLLSFVSMERPEKQSEAGPAPPAAITSQTGTALVEQVLSVNDGAYRFTGYIAQWQGKRVAFQDIGETVLSVGTEARVMVMHASVMGHQMLQFMRLPADAASSAEKSRVSRNVSHETGVIEEVLKATAGGDSYAAYIVLWNGARVALEPEPGSLQQPGESASLRVARTALPIGTGKGLIVFAPDTQESDSSPEGDAGLSASASATTTDGVVERVLAAQVDGYRYRAYVVKWHGAHVVVQDLFATTDHKAGDQISFLIAHTTYEGKRRVTFVLVDPKPPTKEAAH
jgi:hypothetical protein